MNKYIINKSISSISTCEGTRSASSIPISYIDSPFLGVEEGERGLINADSSESKMLTYKDCLEMECLAELVYIERELMNEIGNYNNNIDNYNNYIAYDNNGDVVMQDDGDDGDDDDDGDVVMQDVREEQWEDNAFYLNTKKWGDNAVYLQRA